MQFIRVLGSTFVGADVLSITPQNCLAPDTVAASPHPKVRTLKNPPIVPSPRNNVFSVCLHEASVPADVEDAKFLRPRLANIFVLACVGDVAVPTSVTAV